MGGGRFSAEDWTRSYSASYASKSAAEIYTSRGLDSGLDIKDKIRESVPSADNPHPTPIILGMDVTGSMAPVLEILAKKALPTLCTEIYNRKPVSDPHICVCGIGDYDAHDNSPFQATQFEADIRIAEQLEKLYLEQGGGGNSYEGYSQAWYFALNHTKTTNRGFIFTFGDEKPHEIVTAANQRDIFGNTQPHDFPAQELLDAVTKKWEVYHIVIEQGNNCRSMGADNVRAAWREYLGQHVIPLDDVTKLAEVVVSILEVAAGKDSKAVAASWDGSTSLTVAKAIKDLDATKATPEGMVAL